MNTLDPRDRMTTWQRIKLYIFDRWTWNFIDRLLDEIAAFEDEYDQVSDEYLAVQEQHERAVRWHKKQAHLAEKMREKVTEMLVIEHDIQQAKNNLSKISERVMS